MSSDRLLGIPGALIDGKMGENVQKICPGDTLRYKTDLPHVLKNEGKKEAHGFMVNLL